MYIFKLLGLFTLLFCFSSFTEATYHIQKNTDVMKSVENTIQYKGKPKKKTYSPPKKGKNVKIAQNKKPTARKNTAATKRLITINHKNKKISTKGRYATTKNKKYSSKKHVATKQYAQNTALQEDLEDNLEEEDLIEETEIIDNTDIALPSLSKSKVDTKQQKVLLDTAFSYLGTPYRHGGVTRSGMDCSGFVSTTFKSISVPLSRSSQEMATQGRKISLENVQVGDLLFLKTTRRNRISHVGMVVDIDGDVKFIHSSSKRGVVISSLSEAYYKKAFRMAKRVM